MTIDHAQRINKIRDENERIDLMDRRVWPSLIIAFALISLAVIVPRPQGEYLHNITATMAENHTITTLLTRCANGEAVAFDDGVITCQIDRLVAGAR